MLSASTIGRPAIDAGIIGSREFAAAHLVRNEGCLPSRLYSFPDLEGRNRLGCRESSLFPQWALRCRQRKPPSRPRPTLRETKRQQSRSGAWPRVPSAFRRRGLPPPPVPRIPAPVAIDFRSSSVRRHIFSPSYYTCHSISRRIDLDLSCPSEVLCSSFLDHERIYGGNVRLLCKGIWPRKALA